MPGCTVCGYAVEWLRSCYRSSWRLFKNSTQTTRGQYYFSPPGSLFYPGTHQVWSRNWISEEYKDAPPALGEAADAVRPYTKGGPVAFPPAVLVGTRDCVANGDAYPPAAAGQTTPGGFDSRCWTSQALPIPSAAVPPPFLWLRPDSFTGQSDGDKLAAWPDLGGYHRTPLNFISSLQPVYRAAWLNGLAAVQFTGGGTLVWSPALALGTAHTTYVVATLDATSGTKRTGPELFNTGLTQRGMPEVNSTFIRYAADPSLATLNITIPAGSSQVYWARRSAASVELGARNISSGSFAVDPTAAVQLGGLGVSTFFGSGFRLCEISEVLVYDWSLNDPDHTAVLSYLGAKYQL